MRVLVTRPEPDGERTAEALRARGHDVLLSPVLRMERANAHIPQARYGAVILTSANAARAIAAHPQRTAILDLPVFAVGSRTGEIARETGFGDIRSADGDSRDLRRLLDAEPELREPYLYIAGEDRAADIGSRNIVTVVLYRMVALDRLAAPAEHALRSRKVDGVLHFSARSAQAYVDCGARAEIVADALAPVQFCLSAQVAAPLAAAGARAIRVAPRPHEPGLLALVCAEIPDAGSC